MIFKIESLQNPLVKHLVKLRKERAYRYQQKKIVIEGKKIICELTRARTLFVEKEDAIPQHLNCERIYLVTPTVMKKVSGVQHPEGLVAEVPMPQPQSLSKMRYLLALEGISDPGNLGTLLRSALALGWEGVFFLGDHCDPFNEKALRAAKGATLHLPFRFSSWEQLQKSSLPLLVADLTGQPATAGLANDGAILVLSRESQGVSAPAKAHCCSVTIPMSGAMESLNVAIAGALMMYLLKGCKN